MLGAYFSEPEWYLETGLDHLWEERERIHRMECAGIPPPTRDDECYALQNGDNVFHEDLCTWYEGVTGESLEGMSVIEQSQRAGMLAHRWRTQLSPTLHRLDGVQL